MTVQSNETGPMFEQQLAEEYWMRHQQLLAELSQKYGGRPPQDIGAIYVLAFLIQKAHAEGDPALFEWIASQLAEVRERRRAWQGPR